MTKVLPFPGRDRKRRGRDEAKARARGRTLCDSGFHEWSTDTSTRFDVKRGRLVTVLRCSRCGATRSELR